MNLTKSELKGVSKTRKIKRIVVLFRDEEGNLMMKGPCDKMSQVPVMMDGVSDDYLVVKETVIVKSELV